MGWLVSFVTGGVLDRLVGVYAKAKDAGTERDRSRPA